MAFAQVRLFEITGFDAGTGKPILNSSPLPFLAREASEQEVNNISVTLQPESVEKTYNADNIQEKDTVIKGYNGTFTFYGIDSDALDLISSFRKDTNGNTILGVNTGDEKDICVFYRGKNEKGTAYNMWLYDCEFKPINLDVGQDEDTPTSLTLEFFAKLITINGTKVFGAMVYEGKTGYVTEGTEPTAEDLYIEAVEA